MLCVQVQASGWPAGPKSLRELFEWPKYNAEMLLVKCANAGDHMRNFCSLATRRIVINDAYSGSGTFSVSMHLQHAAMQRHLTLYFVSLESLAFDCVCVSVSPSLYYPATRIDEVWLCKLACCPLATCPSRACALAAPATQTYSVGRCCVPCMRRQSCRVDGGYDSTPDYTMTFTTCILLAGVSSRSCGCQLGG